MANDNNDYRVRLIDLANDVAMAGLPATRAGFHGHEAEFLKRFRAAYLHLNWTVEVTHTEAESEDLSDLEKPAG